MVHVSTYSLSILLAVAACVMGGSLGGLVVAGRAPSPLGPVVEAAGPTARGMGGALIVGHGAVAGMLGYDPQIGACMALGLCFAWAGAAAGRIVIGKRLKLAVDGPSLAFEILMALALATPLWSIMTALSRSGVAV